MTHRFAPTLLALLTTATVACSAVRDDEAAGQASSAQVAPQKTDACTACNDPIAGLEKELAALKAELGLADADIDAMRPLYKKALEQVRDQLAAMGTSPETMNHAEEGDAFFDWLKAHLYPGNPDYAVVQVGALKLVYRHHSAVVDGDGLGGGAYYPESFELIGVYPDTMSDDACVGIDQGQRDLFNLQLLEVGLRVGPWLLVPVVGQTLGAACAVAAGATLLVIDAATGEKLGTIGDDLSFTVLAAGKIAPGYLKALAHIWLLSRLGMACVHVAKNAKLYMMLLTANVRAHLTEDDLLGPVQPGDPPRLDAMCNVRPSLTENIKTCTENNAYWASKCCPKGQVGTGKCTLEEQRCVLDPNGAPPAPAAP